MPTDPVRLAAIQECANRVLRLNKNHYAAITGLDAVDLANYVKDLLAEVTRLTADLLALRQKNEELRAHIGSQAESLKP